MKTSLKININLISPITSSVADPDPVGSERLGPDTDPDPGLNKLPYINFFGECKSDKYFTYCIPVD
jgi:hypothetical protein